MDLGVMQVAGVLALIAILLDKGISLIKWIIERTKEEAETVTKVEQRKKDNKIDRMEAQVEEIHGITILRGLDGRPLVYTSDPQALEHHREIKIAVDRSIEKINDLDKKIEALHADIDDHIRWEMSQKYALNQSTKPKD